MTDSLLPLLLLGVFLIGFAAMGIGTVFFIVSYARRYAKYGSAAGALYKGRVVHTYGTVEAAQKAIMKVQVKVVAVDADAPAVGLEILWRAALGFGLRVVRLTPDEALHVAGALEASADPASGGRGRLAIRAAFTETCKTDLTVATTSDRSAPIRIAFVQRAPLAYQTTSADLAPDAARAVAAWLREAANRAAPPYRG